MDQLAVRKGKTRSGLGPSNIKYKDLLSLVGHIYEAGTDHSQWPNVLRETNRLMGNVGSHLFLMDDSTGLVSHTTHVDMPDRLMSEYNSEVIRICPRYKNACAHPEWDLLWDYQHIQESEIDKSEYYNWLQDRGEGIRYYLGGRLHPSDGSEGFLSLAFGKRQGHATKVHIRLLRELLPHFSRSLQFGRRIGTPELASAASLEFLNHLSDALVLLGPSGTVLVANQAALELARSGGLVRIGTAGIRLRNRKQDEALQALISGAIETANGRATVGGGVIRLCQSPLWVLSVIPIPSRSTHPALVVAKVAVFVRSRPTSRVPCAENLQILFGLTRAEARLTCALIEGVALSEAAVALDISVHTARTQLKQVFSKTGVRRQSDLIRLLGTIVLDPLK